MPMQDEPNVAAKRAAASAAKDRRLSRSLSQSAATIPDACKAWLNTFKCSSVGFSLPSQPTQATAALGQGLPLQRRSRQDRCIPDSCRLAAMSKSAASGHKRPLRPYNQRPSFHAMRSECDGLDGRVDGVKLTLDKLQPTTPRGCGWDRTASQGSDAPSCSRRRSRET